jgi:hypothetical protein
MDIKLGRRGRFEGKAGAGLAATAAPSPADALLFPKLSVWGSGSTSPSSGLRSGASLRGDLPKKDSQIGACLRSDIMMFAPLGTNRFGSD